MEQGYNLIGPDCVAIINDYCNQIDFTRKYDRVMKELKIKVYHHIISERFCLLCWNGCDYHYYQGEDGFLMMIRYMSEGPTLESYLHSRSIEVVYIFN